MMGHDGLVGRGAVIALTLVLVAGWSAGRLGWVHCRQADGSLALAQVLGHGHPPCGDHAAGHEHQDPEPCDDCVAEDECEDHAIDAGAAILLWSSGLAVVRAAAPLPVWILPPAARPWARQAPSAPWPSPPSQGPPAMRGVILLI